MEWVRFTFIRVYCRSLFRSGLRPSTVIPQLSILLNESIVPGQDLLIFDEVQNSPEALTSLKYFKEEMPELALCCAGSRIGLAVSAASFPVGQVEFLTLYPLSFEEFLGATDERSAAIFSDFNDQTVIPETVHGHLWEQLKIYYVTGGLPEVVEHRSDRENPCCGKTRVAIARLCQAQLIQTLPL